MYPTRNDLPESTHQFRAGWPQGIAPLGPPGPELDRQCRPDDVEWSRSGSTRSLFSSKILWILPRCHRITEKSVSAEPRKATWFKAR